MATYKELFDLRNHSELRNRVAVAVTIAARKVMLEAPDTGNHANRMAWARTAFASPGGQADAFLAACLAANAAATTGQITGATDEALQMAVDAAVNVIAGV